ncbi:MAG: condensation domain-containing protein, partial [Vicinamibacteria bacterium]
MRYGLKGPLDAEAFERAWKKVVERHPVLRTSFHWEGTEKPLQVVHREVALPFELHDFRELPPEERARRVEDHARRDGLRGFDLGEAPLLRVALFRLEDDRHDFLWSFHHIVLEGWSASILLKEVFALYRAFSRGVEIALPAPRPYRDYILWLQRQDPRKLETYWREQLSGFDAPTEVAVERAKCLFPAPKERYRRFVARFSETTTEELEKFARSHRLTMSTLLQGAFALLLGRYTGSGDVCYGSVVSGREIDLDGAESIVGLMVNTLPARVRIPGEKPALEWLTDFQRQQFEMRRYEYSSLRELQGWSDVPRGLPLFRTLFAFQNWFGDVSLRGSASDLEVVD